MTNNYSPEIYPFILNVLGTIYYEDLIIIRKFTVFKNF